MHRHHYRKLLRGQRKQKGKARTGRTLQKCICLPLKAKKICEDLDLPPKSFFWKRPYNLKMPIICVIRYKHLHCKIKFLVCKLEVVVGSKHGN